MQTYTVELILTYKNGTITVFVSVPFETLEGINVKASEPDVVKMVGMNEAAFDRYMVWQNNLKRKAVERYMLIVDSEPHDVHLGNYFIEESE